MSNLRNTVMAVVILANILIARSASAAPPNDNLADAAIIDPAGETVFGTSIDATKEPGEEDHAGQAGGSSVWWSWTPAESTRAGFSTAGTEFDTVLAVYTGSGYPLNLVEANDDEDVGSGITTSRLSIDAVANTTYFIAVDGYGGETGNITLQCILDVPGPANDNLADATVISGNSGLVNATNIDATLEPDELEIQATPGGASVWWSWTAPVSDVFVINTQGSTFDTKLGIYTGTAHPLTLVIDDDDGGPTGSSRVMFTTTAGTEYKIVVDGYQGETGSVVLRWQILLPAVTAINRLDPSPTNAGSVDFGVTFNKPVTGVDVTDFNITASGVTGASVAGVTGSGSSYTVTVNTGSGDGNIRLNLVDNDSIIDANANPLGGTGAGNGTFNGQTYSIDKTAPVVASIAAVSGTVVDITFTEAQTLDAGTVLTASNYTVTGDGKGTVPDSPNSVVLQSGKTYRLTWNAGSMINGQPITITVANVADTAGNAIGNPNSGSNLALPVTLSAFIIE